MEATTWQFYLNSDETWEAMLADCAKAEKTIDFEQFIFVNDEVGNRFFELFIAKAKEGVKIRILCDSAGSYALYNSAFPKKLMNEGIDIKFFNHISPWRIGNFTSLFFRDHRKILVIDNKVAYTGGVGVEKILKGWRDTQIRLTGTVVSEISYVFNRMWQIVQYGKFLKFRFPPYLPGRFRFFTVSPHFRQRFFYRRLFTKIKTAKSYIYLTTPYFIPNERFFFNLRRASKRGVDVRLILPEKSDHKLVDAAARSYFGLALKAGIKIYLYNRTMMHAKTAIIDDNWGSVGSANLDNLSFFFNYEANIVSEDHEFVAQLKDHFVNDLLASKEVLLEEWQKRPFGQKLLELLSWPFHSFF